ncbi:MAG: methyltransferase domain-containing protein, partial [Candidatus Rokubacteria bacterium]|nr:methyltransferase domain-containing protein [Candidatus Rokubacteria bacterium]
MRSPWAREYVRRPKDYIWGTEPSSLALEVSDLLPPGARVLDLGCGEGRDSVFFASRGFEVTGVEVSLAGLRKA